MLILRQQSCQIKAQPEYNTGKSLSLGKGKENTRSNIIPHHCRNPRFCHQVWLDLSPRTQGYLIVAASSKLDHGTFYLGKARDEENEMYCAGLRWHS